MEMKQGEGSQGEGSQVMRKGRGGVTGDEEGEGRGHR